MKKNPSGGKPAGQTGQSLSAAFENQFQSQFRAEKSQHQQYESDQCQPYRRLAAPSQLVVSPQQDRKEYPCDQGEHGLVHQMLGKNILDEDESGDDGHGEQQHADQQQLGRSA